MAQSWQEVRLAKNAYREQHHRLCICGQHVVCLTVALALLTQVCRTHPVTCQSLTEMRLIHVTEWVLQ